MLSAKSKQQPNKAANPPRNATVKYPPGYLQGLKCAGSKTTMEYFQTLTHVHDIKMDVVKPVYAEFEATPVPIALKKVLRVESWNIGSSLLSGLPYDTRSKKTYTMNGERNYYDGPEYTPERVKHIIRKIRETLSQGDVILTLQEVSYLFRINPELIAALEEYGYGMLNTAYGTIRCKNAEGVFETVHGHLGVAVIYPMAHVKAIHWETAYPYVNQDAIPKMYGDRTIVTAIFRHHITGQEFVVAAVHVPCEWKNPELMRTLVLANLTCIKTYADGRPVIIGADLNVNYTTDINSEYSSYQVIKQWGYQDLLSHVRTGSFFTNVGSIKDPECKELRFFDLDYILFHKGSKNIGVKATKCEQPSKHVVDALPSATHPSDHFAILACLEFEHTPDPKITSIALQVVTERLLSTKTPQHTSSRKRTNKKHILTLQ